MRELLAEREDLEELRRARVRRRRLERGAHLERVAVEQQAQAVARHRAADAGIVAERCAQATLAYAGADEVGWRVDGRDVQPALRVQ